MLSVEDIGEVYSLLSAGGPCTRCSGEGASTGPRRAQATQPRRVTAA